MKFSLLPLLVCVFFLTGCSSHRAFDSLPRTGFITHYQQSDKKRMSFDSYWDVSDNKDWNERVEGKGNRSQSIYIEPVTTKYLNNYPQNKEKAEDVEEIREYFDKKLREKLLKLDKMDNSFHLVDKPTPDSYRVSIAILSITPTNIKANTAGAATGLLVKGTGALVKGVSRKGSISMGAKFYSPDGKLVAEVADFEEDESAVLVPVDTKDFQHYAHHKRHINIWCDQFCEIFTTKHEHKIKRPWFSLNPF